MAQSKKVRIEAASPMGGGPVLLLPKSWLKDLGVAAGTYRLRFGVKEAAVTVRQAERSETDRLWLSRDVLDALHLPTGENVTLTASGSVLHAGPVLGILANVKSEGERVIGQQQLTFRNLLTAAREQGLFGYVFSPRDIDWDDNTVIAYRLQKGKWTKGRAPLPDVVYDQIISRTFENRADVAPQREKLYRLLKPRYFNPGYFDKWQVHRWLAGDGKTSGYVPDAVVFESVAQAAEFLYKHPDAYLKPVHGSLGMGIIRLQRRSDGRVHYQLKKADGKLQSGTAGTITTFLKKFEKRLRNGPYLIQKALWLRTYHGRPFDIRLLLQKDGAGKWQRTKTFCRIAQAGQITSNLSTGGDALAVKQLLKEVLRDDKKVARVMKRLTQIAEAVPPVIESEAGGTVGELGLDLGLDDFGRIWVIEVNAKPWKKPNTQEGEWRDLALLAFQRPIQYAKFLCKHD